MRITFCTLLFLALSLACAGKGEECDDDEALYQGECVDVDDLGGDADVDADTDTDADADARLAVRDGGYQPAGVEITWSVAANGAIGDAEVWLVETGDAGFEGGCTLDEIGSGGLACGVWTEHHDAFMVAQANNEFGGETMSITLDVVEYPDQASNRSTLFGEEFLSGVTYVFEITDPDGGRGACGAGGNDPAAFADDCPDRL